MGQLPDARALCRAHNGPMATTTNSAGSHESFQIPIEVAEVYEAAFVPAFFAQWAPILCDEAGIAAGHRVLDVACGTGIVARAAADRVAPDGSVTGLDLNQAMLTVARRIRPDIDYRQADAAALPFPDASFDVVVSQMALMFFPDRPAAVREMARVARPAGTVSVLVPGELRTQPAFAPFVAMAGRHAGPEAMSLLGTYFACGDLDELTRLVGAAGLRPAGSRTVQGIYRAPSVDAFVTTEVESTPLLERISERTYQAIRVDAHEVLAPFTSADGSVRAPFEANIVTARKP
jgi:ubiquinone/menaquinone biosynthesis C-methylase UbiE